MKPLCSDLRESMRDALQDGQTRTQVAERFCVSLSSVQRLKKRWTQHRHLDPKPIPGRQRALTQDQAAQLKEIIASRNDWTLASLAQAWEQYAGKAISPSALHRNLHWLGYSYKKEAHRRRARPRKARRFPGSHKAGGPQRPPKTSKDLVFLDECGFSLALHLLYGWGPSKERLVESVPSQQ